jgi:hypothetical protein
MFRMHTFHYGYSVPVIFIFSSADVFVFESHAFSKIGLFLDYLSRAQVKYIKQIIHVSDKRCNLYKFVMYMILHNR